MGPSPSSLTATFGSGLTPGLHRDTSANSDEIDEAAFHIRVNQLHAQSIADLEFGGTAVQFPFAVRTDNPRITHSGCHSGSAGGMTATGHTFAVTLTCAADADGPERIAAVTQLISGPLVAGLPRYIQGDETTVRRARPCPRQPGNPGPVPAFGPDIGKHSLSLPSRQRSAAILARSPLWLRQQGARRSRPGWSVERERRYRPPRIASWPAPANRT